MLPLKPINHTNALVHRIDEHCWKTPERSDELPHAQHIPALPLHITHRTFYPTHCSPSPSYVPVRLPCLSSCSLPSRPACRPFPHRHSIAFDGSLAACLMPRCNCGQWVIAWRVVHAANFAEQCCEGTMTYDPGGNILDQDCCVAKFLTAKRRPQNVSVGL